MQKKNIFILWSDQPTVRHLRDFCIPESKKFNIEMFDIKELLFLSTKNRRNIKLESELNFQKKYGNVKTINSLKEFLLFAYKNRKNSPLIKVKDAILIRTDKLTKKQVLTKMSKHIDILYKK